jgi:hypothetical protein
MDDPLVAGQLNFQTTKKDYLAYPLRSRWNLNTFSVHQVTSTAFHLALSPQIQVSCPGVDHGFKFNSSLLRQIIQPALGKPLRHARSGQVNDTGGLKDNIARSMFDVPTANQLT